MDTRSRSSTAGARTTPCSLISRPLKVIATMDLTASKVGSGMRWSTTRATYSAARAGLRTAAGAERTRRYLYISTLSVYADYSYPRMTKTRRLATQSHDEIGRGGDRRDLRRAQSAVREARGRRVRRATGFTILRPTYICGSGRSHRPVSPTGADTHASRAAKCSGPARPADSGPDESTFRDLANFTDRLSRARSITGTYNMANPAGELTPSASFSRTAGQLTASRSRPRIWIERGICLTAQWPEWRGAGSARLASGNAPGCARA